MFILSLFIAILFLHRLIHASYASILSHTHTHTLIEEEAAAAARPEGSDEESEGDEDEEESEYETDTDESEEGGVGGLISMPKPIFIPKHKRELVKEQEREEREEAEKERKKEIMLERRKRETRNLVAEEIRKDAEGSAENVDDGYGSEAGAPDDVDRPEDDALEFEKWRVCIHFNLYTPKSACTCIALRPLIY